TDLGIMYPRQRFIEDTKNLKCLIIINRMRKIDKIRTFFLSFLISKKYSQYIACEEAFIMFDINKLARINELAKQSNSTGLTDQEKEEQAQLRKAYLQGVRQSFTNQFSSLKVVDPAGNDVTPKKVKDLRKSNKSTDN